MTMKEHEKGNKQRNAKQAKEHTKCVERDTTDYKEMKNKVNETPWTRMRHRMTEEETTCP